MIGCCILFVTQERAGSTETEGDTAAERLLMPHQQHLVMLTLKHNELCLNVIAAQQHQV